MNKQKYEHILDVSRQTRSFSLLCWYSNYVHVAQGGISFYLLYPSIVIILIPRPHKSIKGNVMTYHIQRHTSVLQLMQDFLALSGTLLFLKNLRNGFFGWHLHEQMSASQWPFVLYLIYYARPFFKGWQTLNFTPQQSGAHMKVQASK